VVARNEGEKRNKTGRYKTDEELCQMWYHLDLQTKAK
jgi:hypothetical protein